MIQFFGYPKCSSCQKAKKYLKDNHIQFEDIDITIQPPSKKTLKAILQSENYTINQLFNTSGQLYREMNMKSKIKELSESELVDILAMHGKIVKRPLVTDGVRHTVGFKQDIMKGVWVC